MGTTHIKQKSVITGEVPHLPSSKSLSNRALILQALAGNQPVVSNLSAARDTVLMQKLITSGEKVIDVLDAGTTMRFLAAYFAITGQHKILTGTQRMKERPIGLLVDSLRQIGADVGYMGQEGFPPIETRGFQQQVTSEVTIPGNISSQYISALMMIGPTLPNGINIHLSGKVGSKPYIEMTATLMRHFGATCHFQSNEIRIPATPFEPAPYRVEGDWSGASYWFGVAALSQEASISLPGMSDKSVQGDRAIVEIMEKLGVKAIFDSEGAHLQKSVHAKNIEWDFTDCPDLAQTVLPVCAAKGVVGTFTGMESLFIKETDRIAALQKELKKIRGSLYQTKAGTWNLEPGDLSGITKIEVETYHDHRMAMGFAPLATLLDVTIKDPEVVNKSYPGFWEDMKNLGFEITTL